jgi:hypothetical protein
MLWLLIGYMFLFIHRPFEVWPSLAVLRIELLYMLIVGTIWLVAARKQWVSNAQHWAFAAFAAATILCWIASPYAWAGELAVENYIKLLVFYIMIVTVVQNEIDLRHITLGFLGVMFVYMLHSYWEYRNGRHFYRMGIARMIGVDTSLGDPNSFGASIIYSLPFVTPFWLCFPSKKLKLFLAGYVMLALLCIGLTGSRGSLLGFVFWAVFTIGASKWRYRLAPLALVLAPVLWCALPESLQTRFETIVHPEVGPKNAQESGESRLEGFNIGCELWGRSPLTGIGPGAWRPASGSKLESHNLYGQVVGEMGTLGAITFAAVVACYWINLRAVRRAYREHPEWDRDFLWHLSGALQLGLFLLLLQGLGGHNLFRYNWLWYGGFLLILRQRVERRCLVHERDDRPLSIPYLRQPLRPRVALASRRS